MTVNTNAAKRATQFYFLLCGLGLSAWAPMVPFAKERLALNDASLGMLLLFLGIGAICAMPVTGWLINRIGSRLVMLISAVILAFGLPALVVVNTRAGMAAMLFIFGAALGSVDVAMNAHGSLLQNVSGKHIMSSLHGLFSVGGLLGPLVIGAFIKAGVAPFYSAMVLSVALIIVAVSQEGSLLNRATEQQLAESPTQSDEQNDKQPSAWFNATVIFLGAMCFISFLSEGAMLDWSALLLYDNKGVDKAFAGLGYASFSVAMAVMRLFGDKIISKFNSKVVVLAGSVVAFAGYAFILFAPWVPVTLLGFILIGIGAANIVPVFFSAAGSVKGVSAAAAIATMGTIGYAGQLAGPAALGILAQHFSLPIALFITGFLLLTVGVSFRFSRIKI